MPASVRSLLTERIAPHSLEAEAAVLGACLIDPRDLAEVVARLSPDDFFPDQHRQLFGAMRDLLSRGQAVTLISVVDALRQSEQLELFGGQPRLARLVEEAALPGTLGTYCDLIKDHALARAVIQEATSAIQGAYTGQSGPALLATLTEHLERLLARRTASVQPFGARSVPALLATDTPDPTFLVHGWLPARALSYCVGDSEAYKSWFTLYMALCIAGGLPLFGRIPVLQSPTLVISEENGIAEDKRRVRRLCSGLGVEVPDCYIASESGFSFDDPVGYASLRAFVAAKQIRALFVDSFVRVHRRKENDAGEMNALYLDRLKPLIADGAAVCLLHHRRKTPTQNGGPSSAPANDADEIRGSGDLRAATHSVLFLRTVSDVQVLVKHNKTRGFKRQEPFVFTVRDTDDGGVTLTWDGRPEEALDKSAGCREAILLFAQERGTFTRKAIVEALKPSFHRKVVDPLLKTLSDPGYPLRKDQVGRRYFYQFVPGTANPDMDPDLDGKEPW